MEQYRVLSCGSMRFKSVAQETFGQCCLWLPAKSRRRKVALIDEFPVKVVRERNGKAYRRKLVRA